ncbi:hypothetical protein ABK040_005212 [Willaertia magna]
MSGELFDDLCSSKCWSKIDLSVLNKLNDDELLHILGFLDISSLCRLNCASKYLILSKLSKDDRFWKYKYINLMEEVLKNQSLNKALATVLSKLDFEKKLQITEGYKKGIFEFVNDLFKAAEKVQKERLSHIKVPKNSTLIDFEKALNYKLTTKLKEPKDFKVLTVGDGAVGKTCLLLYLSTGILFKAYDDYVPTVFDNYRSYVEIDNQPYVCLTLWDTGGQDEYSNIRPLCYSNTDLFLICFDINGQDEFNTTSSFDNISKKWLPEINQHCPNTPIILCGCKVGNRDNPKLLYQCIKKKGMIPISREEGEAKAKEIGAIAYVETSTSTMTQKDANDLNQFFVKLLLEKVCQTTLKKN